MQSALKRIRAARGSSQLQARLWELMCKHSSGFCCPAVSVAVVWYCSGLGYVMSVMLEPQNSMVASVAIVLVLGGFFNGVEPRFRTLTPTMKAVFGAPRSPLALGEVMPHVSVSLN